MFKLIAATALAAVTVTNANPSVPSGFDPEHRYVISVDEEFNNLDNWDKQLGEWLGTAPGAFNDANTMIKGKNQKFLRLLAQDEPGFFPPGVDAECDCGFKQISTGIVVSKQMYQYGVFEIEARMPDASLLSSFWLQGMKGEINIADVSNTASSGKIVSHNYHCFEMGTDGSGTVSAEQSFNHMTLAPDFDVTKFHTYGIHWDETGVSYFIDGAQVGEKLSAGCLDEEMNVVLSMETIATDVPDNFGAHRMDVKSFRHYTIEETTTTTTTTPEPSSGTVCDGADFAVEAKFKAADVCASAKPQGKCYKKIKHAAAQAECAAVGARMCTVDEIKGGVARTLSKSQCKVHGKPVWTATECTTAAGNPGIFVTRGDGKNAKKDDCIDTTAKKFVRTKKALVCCADVGVEMGDEAPSPGQIPTGGSRQSQMGFVAQSTDSRNSGSAGSGDSSSAGGSAAAAGIGGIVCVVAIIGVAMHRRRQAGITETSGADPRMSEVDIKTEGRRYSGDLAITAMTESSAAGDLETDNGFVLDAAGSLRVVSVRRGNPAYRNSIYTAAEDEIGTVGIAEVSGM